jgi:DNA polymerase/3'-5' exonuclease PolX
MRNLTVEIHDCLFNHASVEKNIYKKNAFNRVIVNISSKKIYKIEDFKKIKGVGKGILERCKHIFANNTGEDVSASPSPSTSTPPPQPASKKQTTQVTSSVNTKSQLNTICDFTKVYGIGISKATELVKIHKIKTIEELMTRPDLLNAQQKIGIKYYEDLLTKIPYNEMKKHNDFLANTINSIELQTGYSIKYSIVGSYRRKVNFSGDIDVLITSQTPEVLRVVVNALWHKNYILETLAQGQKKFMGISKLPNSSPRRIDILLTPPEEFPFAQLYFTGSKEFNIAMRKHALTKNISLNEHGISPAIPSTSKDFHSIHSKIKNVKIGCEKDIFDFLEYNYISPENR